MYKNCRETPQFSAENDTKLTSKMRECVKCRRRKILDNNNNNK